MRKAIKVLDIIFFRISCGLLLFMALAVFFEVIMRYFLGKPTTWINEVSGYLLVAVVFFGASHAMLEGKHVKFDLLINRLPNKWRISVLAVVTTISLAFVTVLAWQGVKLAFLSWKFNWHASTVLRTPLFIPQIVIPLGGFVLGLQIVLCFFERDIKKPRPGRIH